MERELLIRFVGEDVSVRASMLWESAPTTCGAVWEALPLRGLARHAIYSGSEVYLPLPAVLKLPREHSTSRVAPGEVAFAWFEKGSSYGVEADLAEVCWFYDRDATPSMAEGPVPVNVFARFHDNDQAFSAVCRRMRLEGAKEIELRRA